VAAPPRGAEDAVVTREDARVAAAGAPALRLERPGEPALRLERLGALPPAAWLALPLLAAWPTWRWMGARLADGSDEPWGLVALAALASLVWRERESFAQAPRASLLLASGVLLAAAAVAPAPALARAVLAVGALVAAMGAVRRRDQPLLALAGLALLSLPLLASLQFYAGYPLRVVTAEATRLLFALAGVAVERSGTALEVGGRLVIVDAPCAGVQMGWAAYAAACAAGAWLRLPDRRFLARLPLVGAIVLAGNVVRNTLLVLGETRGPGLDEAAHELVGLAVFAAVCAAVLWQVGRDSPRAVRVEVCHAPR
jgi:exosortase/archaeosortase family protein